MMMSDEKPEKRNVKPNASEKNMKSDVILKKKPVLVKDNHKEYAKSKNDNSEFFKTHKELPRKGDNPMYNTVRESSREKVRPSHEKGKSFQVKENSSKGQLFANNFLNNKNPSTSKVTSKPIKLKKKKGDDNLAKKSDRQGLYNTDGFKPYFQEKNKDKNRAMSKKKGMSKTKPNFNKELYGSDRYVDDTRKSKSKQKKYVQEMDHSGKKYLCLSYLKKLYIHTMMTTTGAFQIQSNIGEDQITGARSHSTVMNFLIDMKV